MDKNQLEQIIASQKQILEEIASIRANTNKIPTIENQLRLIDTRLNLIEQRLAGIEPWISVDHRHLEYKQGSEKILA